MPSRAAGTGLSQNREPFSALALRRKYGIFSERGLALYATGIGGGFIVGLAAQLFGFAKRYENGNCIDFVWLWLSSHFAASSLPVRVYDYAAFSAAKTALLGPSGCILEHFDYPPTLLFFVYPLHLLPYGIAFAVWIAATLGIYLMAVYLIIPHRNALLVACTIYPAWINILIGHDGFLTAGLMGLALAWAETRPRVAGIFLALLSYKPQFGILFPSSLALSRNWRMLIAATTASILFAAIAGYVFGYETWPAFLHALSERASALSENRGSAKPLVSVLFLLSLGVSSELVWTFQLAIAAVAASAVCLVWARPYPYALKAASLATGTLIVSPHVISYDVCMLAIGTAFFVKDGLERGFRRGERATLLVCWLVLHRFVIGPAPMIVCSILLGLTVLRALRCPAGEQVQTGGLEETPA